MSIENSFNISTSNGNQVEVFNDTNSKPVLDFFDWSSVDSFNDLSR